MQLRKGMWVVYGNRVGILVTSPSGAQFGEVHLVAGEEGVTDLVLPQVPLHELRQARLSEIPRLRRPSPGRGAALGYV